jgi:hypothetical protein
MHLKGSNDYSSFGLHLGLDLVFHCGRQVKLFGAGSFSILYGQFNVSEKVGGLNVLVNQSSSRLFHEHQKFFQVINDLGASFGVEWEPFHLRKAQIAFIFAYDMIKVFGQNQFRRYRNQNPQNRLNGDLGLQGIHVALACKI